MNGLLERPLPQDLGIPANFAIRRMRWQLEKPRKREFEWAAFSGHAFGNWVEYKVSNEKY